MLEPDPSHHQLAPPVILRDKHLELIHISTHLAIKGARYLRKLAASGAIFSSCNVKVLFFEVPVLVIIQILTLIELLNVHPGVIVGRLREVFGAGLDGLLRMGVLGCFGSLRLGLVVWRA